MKNKKAISPLISWVLIVSFAIAMALLVIPFIIDQIGNWDFDPEIEYCKDVSLLAEDVCKDDDGVVHLDLVNTGDFAIKKITLGRTTNLTAEQWCSYPELHSIFPFNPGDSESLGISLEKNYTYDVSLETFPECSDLSVVDSEVGAVKIVLVPWIKPDPEVEILQCDERKIVLENSIILNTNCS